MGNPMIMWIGGAVFSFLSIGVPFLTLFSPLFLKGGLQSETSFANWYWDDPHENARCLALSLAALRVALVVLLFTVYDFTQAPAVLCCLIFGTPLEYAMIVPLSTHFPALTWLGVLGCSMVVFGSLFVFWLWWLRTFYQEDGRFGRKELRPTNSRYPR